MGEADQLGKVGSEPEGWRHARLIPTTGTRSQQEQEKRATSCLLAVMHGVPEFGHALLHELGAPKAPVIETFTEVRLKDAQGKTVIPDGAVVCRRAGKAWTALVEVKTGSARLKDDQVTSYVDVARANGFDGVLTISTQITASVDESPVMVSGVKLRSVCLWHLSWWRILTEAVVQQRYRKISDPDQEWVLRELIHYLSNEASGAFGFEDMGESWVSVRKAAHDGTLRHTDPGARDVAERWEQFTQYLALSFSQELGAAVTVQRPRKKTTGERIDAAAKTLATVGMLDATLRVPDAVGLLQIRADLRARQTLVSVTIDAPTEGQLRARFSWLLKQLSDAPDDLLVEATFPNARVTAAAPLGKLREDPKALFYPPDPKRFPRTFIVSRSRTMGHKRGRAEGSFVRETSAQAVAFYRDHVQELKAWQAKAPRVREPEPEKSPVASTELVVSPPWGESVPAPPV
jgi:hypothetical protein